MSAKRSRALSRLENHNVSPVRTKNERSGNESQRKSKSDETFSRPRSEDNVPISHHHSKRSRERSPLKKRSRSRSRERSPSKKRSRSRSRSSRRKRSQSPRPGPSKDRHSVSSESGVSSSARESVHRDREVTPEWARFLVQAQQASDERLFMLESEVKRSSEEYNVISSKPKHKFNKKIYGDQYEFNVKISAILRKALSSRDELDKQTHINEGIELINKRNKLLVLADAHGWEVAEAYNTDPLADDSADEKKVRKAKKEGKILRDQKFKNARMLRARNRAQKKPLQNFQRFNSYGSASVFATSYPVSPNITCWRCNRAGHYARFCKAPIYTFRTQPFFPPFPTRELPKPSAHLILLVIQMFLKSVVLKKSALILALVRDKLTPNYAQIFSRKFCHINPLVLRIGYQKTSHFGNKWVLLLGF